MFRHTRLSLVALLLVATFVACGNDDDPNGDDVENATDWPAVFELPELVAASDAIVIATLREENVETIEFPVEEGEEARDSVTEILRSYQVEESLAGDLMPGDFFTTFSTANVAHDPGDGSAPSEIVYQVLRLEPGETVVLFLTVVGLPDHYPEEWGSLAWAAPVEPHTARVGDDGALQWETTGRYDAAREAQDVGAGDQGASPALDVTLDDLRAEIAESFPMPQFPSGEGNDEGGETPGSDTEG